MDRVLYSSVVYPHNYGAHSLHMLSLEIVAAVVALEACLQLVLGCNIRIL